MSLPINTQLYKSNASLSDLKQTIIIYRFNQQPPCVIWFLILFISLFFAYNKEDILYLLMTISIIISIQQNTYKIYLNFYAINDNRYNFLYKLLSKCEAYDTVLLR